MEYYRTCGTGENKFLGDFTVKRLEILLMGIAYRGKYRDIGANHPFQTLHFAALRYAGLDYRDIGIVAHHKQRQGDTQLRIVTARRTEKFRSGRDALGNPLLDYRFAVGAADGYDRSAILRPPVCCKGLQSGERIGDLHDAAIRRQVAVAFDHKRPYATVVHRVQILVRIVIDSVDGDEHRAVARSITAAVGSDRHHRAVFAAKFAAADCRYFG